MRKSEVGGRVSLDREVLIGLRRERGLSQELFAMMCAEQRYCVSIASIKRAETGKNILYRTARDIALFFEVDLAQIITADERVPLAPTKPARDSFIPARRKLVVLYASLDLPESEARSEYQEFRMSAGKLAAGRFDAEFHPIAETGMVFLFGRPSLLGYEPFQAYYCLRWLQDKFHSLLAENDSLTGRIFSLDEPGEVATDELGDDEVEAMLDQKSLLEVAAQAGEPESLLVDDYVRQGLQARFHLTPVAGKLLFHGQSLWQLHEGEQSALEVQRFIGRELQFQQFKAATESAYAYEEIQLIYVRGLAGIGKTRLLEEFCDHAESLGIEYHKTHILDFGAERSHQTIPRLLRSILGIDDDERNLGLAELETRFGQPVCDPSELLFLYSWLNWPLSARDLSLFKTMNYETRSAGLRGVVANLIRRATRKSPLLLCLEDLHWADDDLLDSIQQLVESIKDSPVILLMTSRQENDPLQNRWASVWTDLPMLVMNLTPLRDSEASQFAGYFLDLPEEFKRLCIERAEGNPLFLEQLLRCADNQAQSLPYTLQSLVQSRLDDLDANSQSVVRAASVLGQWFTEAALQHLVDAQTPDIKNLIEHYLIKRSGERLQFVHALVQEGVYQTITDSARIDLHRRCAEWFETVDSALRARHLARANDAQTAAAYLQAIQEKVDLHAFDEALLLIEEAISIEFVEIDRAQLNLFKGEAMQARGDIEEAICCFRVALEKAPTKRQKFAPLINLANALDTQEQFDQALQSLAEAETCLEGPDDNLELSQIHYLRGNLYFPRGQVQECYQQHQGALDYARKAQDPYAEARALGGLGDASYAQGKMLTALNHFEQCLEISISRDFSQIEAANRFMLGTTRIYHNDTKQALSDALDSAELAVKVGHKRAEIVSRLTAGWVLLDMLDLASAESQIELGLELARDIGAQRFEPFLTESLARVARYQGDLDRSRTLLGEAYDEVHRQGVEEFIGPWVIGSYALALGSGARMLELLDEGSQMLQRNCVGHNFYRFYVYAIECALQNRDLTSLQGYQVALQEFTRDEPTPWSEFYLRRASAVAASWEAPGADDVVTELRALHSEAERVCLRHALPLLSDAIDSS